MQETNEDDVAARQAALAGLLGPERLTRQVAAARASEWGRWIDCDRPGDSERKIVDLAIRQAARLLPGIPVAADLRFEVLAVWSGGTDEDEDDDDWGRGLVGVVTLADGRTVRLGLGADYGAVEYREEILPPPGSSTLPDGRTEAMDKVRALRALLDLRSIDQQVRACRESDVGGDLMTEDSDQEIVDWLIEEAASRLPGVPASGHLDLVAISQATMWDDGGPTDVEPMARLCGVVALVDGREVGLTIEVWGSEWAYVCNDVPPDLRVAVEDEPQGEQP